MTTVPWKDLKKAADDATKCIPADWYDVGIIKAEATTAATSGAPMIKIVFDVTSGPHAGRQIFTQWVLSTDNGFALGIFFRNCAAFGVDPEVVSPNGDLGSLAQALVGRTARAKTKIREWQGQERAEVEQYASASPGIGSAAPGPIGGLPGVPMTPPPGVSAIPPVVASAAPVSVAPATPSAPPALPY